MSVILNHNRIFLSQAREKYLSLRKGTKSDIATVLEEVLFNVNLKVILSIFG